MLSRTILVLSFKDTAGFNLVLFPQVSVYLQNWSHVLSYVNKAESTPEIAEVSSSRAQMCHVQLGHLCLHCI